jgi:hypothetical protein
MAICIKCDKETCYYMTDLCIDHLEESVAKTNRGEFECCENKEHDQTCFLNNCDKPSCHLCPKICSKCNNQATVHAISMGEYHNLCNKHKPSPGEEWPYYHPELTEGCMMMLPHVFDLKTKQLLPRYIKYKNGELHKL